ncbi:MAG: hypothetical protein ACREND_11145, partial [Gemmatimonadaceae bacterium]
IRLTRAAGVLGRVGRLFGLAHRQAGPGLSWEDELPDSIPGRSLRYAITDVPPGSYHLEVIVTTPRVHGTAARDIDVVE